MKKTKKVILLMSMTFICRDLLFFFKMRGFGKENDKDLFIQACAIKRFPFSSISRDDAYEILTIAGREVRIVFNPYIHMSLRVAGCIASCLNIGKDMYVIVDNTFRKLSRNCQMAIICHELGHDYFNHNAQVGLMGQYAYASERARYAKIGKVYWMELDADAYAVKIMPRERFIAGLQELKTHTFGMARKEIEQRIKVLS